MKIISKENQWLHYIINNIDTKRVNQFISRFALQIMLFQMQSVSTYLNYILLVKVFGKHLEGTLEGFVLIF